MLWEGKVEYCQADKRRSVNENNCLSTEGREDEGGEMERRHEVGGGEEEGYDR